MVIFVWKSHFDYLLYFLYCYKLQPLTKNCMIFPLLPLNGNFRTDTNFPIFISYFRLYRINEDLLVFRDVSVRQQSACSLCSYWLYCSFSVAPADGERKRLYGVNEWMCRSIVGDDAGLSVSPATARQFAAVWWDKTFDAVVDVKIEDVWMFENASVLLMYWF